MFGVNFKIFRIPKEQLDFKSSHFVYFFSKNNNKKFKFFTRFLDCDHENSYFKKDNVHSSTAWYFLDVFQTTKDLQNVFFKRWFSELRSFGSSSDFLCDDRGRFSFHLILSQSTVIITNTAHIPLYMETLFTSYFRFLFWFIYRSLFVCVVALVLECEFSLEVNYMASVVKWCRWLFVGVFHWNTFKWLGFEFKSLLLMLIKFLCKLHHFQLYAPRSNFLFLISKFLPIVLRN